MLVNHPPGSNTDVSQPLMPPSLERASCTSVKVAFRKQDHVTSRTTAHRPKPRTLVCARRALVDRRPRRPADIHTYTHRLTHHVTITHARSTTKTCRYTHIHTYTDRHTHHVTITHARKTTKTCRYTHIYTYTHTQIDIHHT